MANKSATRRLFIALWPDDDQRQQLRQLIHTLPEPAGGRPVQPDNWHFTLQYIGACDAERQACVEGVLQALPIPVIENLVIDHSGFFARPRVVWLGCHRVPEPLVELVTRLASALEQSCAIEAEKRPYVPHLTIHRKVRGYRGQALATPLELSFDGIALVESVTHPEGAQYQVLKHYPANRP
jgi:2'-5' RNA ligase